MKTLKIKSEIINIIKTNLNVALNLEKAIDMLNVCLFDEEYNEDAYVNTYCQWIDDVETIIGLYITDSYEYEDQWFTRETYYLFTEEQMCELKKAEADITKIELGHGSYISYIKEETLKREIEVFCTLSKREGKLNERTISYTYGTEMDETEREMFCKSVEREIKNHTDTWECVSNVACDIYSDIECGVFDSRLLCKIAHGEIEVIGITIPLSKENGWEDKTFTAKSEREMEWLNKIFKDFI